MDKEQSPAPIVAQAAPAPFQMVELPVLYVLLGYEGEAKTALINQLVQLYNVKPICLANLIEQERNTETSRYHRVLLLFQALTAAIPDELSCRVILKHIIEDNSPQFVLVDYPKEPCTRITAISNILAPRMDLKLVVRPLIIDTMTAGSSTATPSDVSHNIRETVKHYFDDLNLDVQFELSDPFIRAKVNADKSYEEIFQAVQENYAALRGHKWDFEKK